ncbi:MAG TPA: hypothetical protein VJ203_11110 [Bacteroidales bacterium]|nr:hypothetical protein [Bacteroidales bacterium]
MHSGLQKIIFRLSILSAGLFLLGMILFKTMLQVWYFSFFPVLILIFFLINTGFFTFFHSALKRSDNLFVRSFMITTGIKLLLYLILILAYVLTSPRSAIPFSITLSVLYIAYTAYDLYVMLTLLKRKKENNTLPNQLSN